MPNRMANKTVIEIEDMITVGALAEKLARQAPGSQWTFQGFLATARNSKMLVLHIQDIQQN